MARISCLRNRPKKSTRKGAEKQGGKPAENCGRKPPENTFALVNVIYRFPRRKHERNGRKKSLPGKEEGPPKKALFTEAVNFGNVATVRQQRSKV